MTSVARADTKMAEREGFEPSVEEAPTPVFETDPFDRSGTSPCVKLIRLVL